MRKRGSFSVPSGFSLAVTSGCLQIRFAKCLGATFGERECQMSTRRDKLAGIGPTIWYASGCTRLSDESEAESALDLVRIVLFALTFMTCRQRALLRSASSTYVMSRAIRCSPLMQSRSCINATQRTKVSFYSNDSSPASSPPDISPAVLNDENRSRVLPFAMLRLLLQD